MLLLILSGCLAKPPAEKDIKHILQESRTLKKAFETEVLWPIAECQGKNTLWLHGLVGPVGDVYSSQYKYTYIIYIYVYVCVRVCECVYIYICVRMPGIRKCVSDSEFAVGIAQRDKL